MEGRAAVASASTGHTATTERGPPERWTICVQNAHKLSRKGLISIDRPGRRYRT